MANLKNSMLFKNFSIALNSGELTIEQAIVTMAKYLQTMQRNSAANPTGKNFVSVTQSDTGISISATFPSAFMLDEDFALAITPESVLLSDGELNEAKESPIITPDTGLILA